ncbi:phosphatase PAP2 family protein [uncultured Paraglaciecola sp.]|uniref:phosphatase PAP2 family protein n=1 Tax=uncultured Paraglaciecola sp. TaxID=1765024 RepID=UPI002593031E|nr:phosphatase PAP2 family protein [uncultured Paraglaciecola sp.]
MKSLLQSDKALFHWLFNLTANRDCRWIKWLSKTGDGQLYLIIGLLLWYLEPEHGDLFLYTALLAYAFEVPLYILLKKSLRRQRPCNQQTNIAAHIVPSDKFSLPSGHTAAAFLMASLLASFYPIIAIPVYTWACCIGCSRVLLGVHYPGDILAGAALGIGISVLSLSLF